MAKKYDHLVKLMLIGDSGVGKTAVLVRFVDNEFTPAFMTTIGEYYKGVWSVYLYEYVT